GGALQGRLEQGEGAADLPLRFLPLAHVAADHDRAGGLAVVDDRRDRDGQLDALPVLGLEDVLLGADGAAAPRRRERLVVFPPQIPEAAADQLVLPEPAEAL